MKQLYPLVILLLFLMAGTTADAQVKGVSYTLAPSVSYNWFNDGSGLEDAFMVGGRLGFGFGEYVELRATYLQTINQSTDFAGLDIGLDSTFLNSDVDLARYGAELKLNIGRGTLLPYLLLGGGIQDLQRRGLNNAENVFGTAGIGLTLSAADRYTLGVEGKYIAYSFNAVQNLLDDAERSINDLDLDAFDSDQVGTYSVAANLQFYLGGRRPGQLSDIDQEYRAAFQGGVRGLSIPVDVGLARVKWDDGLPYRDAYFLGGSAGFNFGPLISLRGFYYKGMNDDELSFDFDDIALYGGDFRFNLSQAKSGIAPFLSVGGGYIDISDGYNDDLPDSRERAGSQGFASGGGGVNLRFGDRFTINGGARALLTSGTDFDEINTTEQLRTSWMYNAGLKFIIGGSNDTPDVIRLSEAEDQLSAQQAAFERRSDSLRLENKREVIEIRKKYEDRIAELNQELNDALEAGDTAVAADIREEKQEAQDVVNEIEKRVEEIAAEEKVEEQRELDRALGRTPQPTMMEQREIIIERSDRSEQTDYREKYFQSEMDRRFDQLNYRLDRLEDALERQATPMPRARNPRPEGGGRAAQLDRRLQEIERRLMLSDSNASSTSEQGEKSTDNPATDPRVEQLQRQVEELQRSLNDRKKSAEDSGDADNSRLREMERELDDLRGRLREREDDMGQREDRLRQMEQRLLDRFDDAAGDQPDDDRRRALRLEMQDELDRYRAGYEEEIEDLRRQLEASNRRRERQDDRLMGELSDQERDEERALRREQRRLARQARDNAMPSTDDTAPAAPVQTSRSLDELNINTGGDFLAEEDNGGFFGQVTYAGMSGFAGLNLGDASFLNFGLRWHYKVGERQQIEFMPEAYVGLGKPTTFGLFANAIYPILRSENSALRPYAGAGLGLMQVEDGDAEDETNLTPAVSLIVGSYLPVGNGRLFVDFSTRNFFNNNQLVGGYRFNF